MLEQHPELAPMQSEMNDRAAYHPFSSVTASAEARPHFFVTSD